MTAQDVINVVCTVLAAPLVLGLAVHGLAVLADRLGW